MTLIREGIELKNSILYENPLNTYHVGLCLGSWSPRTTSSVSVLGSEITNVRAVPDSIVTGWDDLANVDTVTITASFYADVPLTFNRVFLIINGRERAKYTVDFTGFNGFTINEPTFNNFQVGDRLVYDTNYYFVDSVSGLDVVVVPDTGVLDLPSTGTGEITDATGSVTIGSSLPNVFNIPQDETSVIILSGNSFGG